MGCQMTGRTPKAPHSCCVEARSLALHQVRVWLALQASLNPPEALGTAAVCPHYIERQVRQTAAGRFDPRSSWLHTSAHPSQTFSCLVLRQGHHLLPSVLTEVRHLASWRGREEVPPEPHFVIVTLAGLWLSLRHNLLPEAKWLKNNLHGLWKKRTNLRTRDFGEEINCQVETGLCHYSPAARRWSRDLLVRVERFLPVFPYVIFKLF